MASEPGVPGRHRVRRRRPDGEYGIFVLWNSEDNAAAAQVIRPKLQEFFAGNVQRLRDVRLFKVLS